MFGTRFSGALRARCGADRERAGARTADNDAVNRHESIDHGAGHRNGQDDADRHTSAAGAERPGASAAKSLDRPDRVGEAPGVIEEIVQFGNLIVARATHAPGWRWSTHIKPIVGTESCQIRHVGFVLSGRIGVELPDGSLLDSGPGTVYDVPPGHDGWTIGDEPAVAIEWTGVLEWLVPAQGERILVSLLFTDIVGSTEHARRLGDRRWRGLLAAHDEAIRQLVAVTRGREITTTGDGFLVVFDGPARAIRTAVTIRESVRAIGLELRQAVHVGEVELVGTDVLGIAVHEAARIMGAASSGEILVSSITKALAAGSGYAFTERGVHELRGFSEPIELFAVDAV
jgi:class 3 adenylate cyclase